MIAWTDHLLIVPIVLPLAASAIMLMLGEGRRRAKSAISIATSAMATTIIAWTTSRSRSVVSAFLPVVRYGDMTDLAHIARGAPAGSAPAPTSSSGAGAARRATVR